MASTTYHTILIYRNGVRDGYIHEDEADEAITPGMLVSFDTDEEIQKHAVADGVQSQMFALENPYDDDTSEAAIDSDYAVADTVRYFYAVPGDVVYALNAHGGSAAVKGVSRLVSNGAGLLKVVTVDASTLATAVVGVAEEDVDNSGGSAKVRIKVRIV